MKWSSLYVSGQYVLYKKLTYGIDNTFTMIVCINGNENGYENVNPSAWGSCLPLSVAHIQEREREREIFEQFVWRTDATK